MMCKCKGINICLSCRIVNERLEKLKDMKIWEDGLCPFCLGYDNIMVKYKYKKQVFNCCRECIENFTDYGRSEIAYESSKYIKGGE